MNRGDVRIEERPTFFGVGDFNLMIAAIMRPVRKPPMWAMYATDVAPPLYRS